MSNPRPGESAHIIGPVIDGFIRNLVAAARAGGYTHIDIDELEQAAAMVRERMARAS